MYPTPSNKFSTMRPPSPNNFVNFSPPTDYPLSSSASSGNNHLHNHHNHLHHHHHGMSMKHNHTKNLNNNNINFNKNLGNCHLNNMMVNSATISGGSGGDARRNELMFQDDLDSIEFCMPESLMTTSGNNGLPINCGGAINSGYPGDSYTTERRRRGHSRRSNHKSEVEQQVKWTRKNIAATMERFEPTNSSKMDYGTTTTQTIQSKHHQPINHVYSYAYYEPGAAKCHTNIPTHKDLITPTPSPLLNQGAGGGGGGSGCSSPGGGASSISPIPGPSKSPPRNSIRALLAKSFRSKTLTNSQQHQQHFSQQMYNSSNLPLSAEERHTYTTRYGTTENLYEEVSEQKIRKVLSDNRIVSMNSPNVKEELRRVQHNHFRVLDELNLSLEALIMPPTPPDISPTTPEAGGATAISPSMAASTASAVVNNKMMTQHSNSMENLSSTLNSIELKDHTCINPEFDEGDLDSGFSGSGSSSGASYNESSGASYRYYKTNGNNVAGMIQTNAVMTTTLPHNMKSCRSSTASGTSTSKSSMNSDDHNIGLTATMTSANVGAGSPFHFGRRCSTDTQKSCNNVTTTGTKPKKHFWTIKQ